MTQKTFSFFYFLLRGFTVCAALILGMGVIGTYFIIKHDGPPQNLLLDQILALRWFGQMILFVTTVIPPSWTLRARSLRVKIAMIVCSVVWALAVDIYQYWLGLSPALLNVYDYFVLSTGAALYMTLKMKQRGQEFQSTKQKVA